MAAKGTTTKAPADAEKAAIAALPGRLVAAWAKHDADAFAKLFVEDGTMILPGVYQKGRADIRAFMSKAFAGPYKDTQVIGSPLELQFLSEESAVMVTEGGVIAAGAKELAPEDTIRASWVVVKRDGEWSLATYQNSPK
jgi:uncharacterized protein (TIGR02246 family)